MGSGARGERWEGIKHEDRAQDVHGGQVPTLRHAPLLCSGSDDLMARQPPRKSTDEQRRQVVRNEESGSPVEKFNGDFGASFVREFAQRWVAGRRGLFFTARSSALLIFLREAEKACSPGLHGNR